MTGEQKQRVLELRDAGKSYSFISEETGLSVGTLKSFCKRQRDSTMPFPTNEISCGPDVATEISNPTEISTPEEERITLPCKHCGKPVVQTEGRKEKKFCADACRTAWWNRHHDELRGKAGKILICPGCGKTFYGYKGRKYCSHPCYIRHRYN